MEEYDRQVIIKQGSQMGNRPHYTCDEMEVIMEEDKIKNGIYVVTSEMTEIPITACYENEELKKIVFHPDVKRIKTLAFYGCKNIESIEELPDGAAIERMCFHKCFKINDSRLRNELSWTPFADKIISMARAAFDITSDTEIDHYTNLKPFVTNYSYEFEDESTWFRYLYQDDFIRDENDAEKWMEFLKDVANEFGIDAAEDYSKYVSYLIPGCVSFDLNWEL